MGKPRPDRLAGGPHPRTIVDVVYDEEPTVPEPRPGGENVSFSGFLIVIPVNMGEIEGHPRGKSLEQRGVADWQFERAPEPRGNHVLHGLSLRIRAVRLVVNAQDSLERRIATMHRDERIPVPDPDLKDGGRPDESGHASIERVVPGRFPPVAGVVRDVTPIGNVRDAGEKLVGGAAVDSPLEDLGTDRFGFDAESIPVNRILDYNCED